ncbi:MAG: hypothetical protein V2I40_15990 [Desulfobacteraceae bacterium]|jgi:hypothetical protein|nr:hypothetical protein [Desulfobacteraceae bacterium]
MPEDIRNRSTINHADVAALNFVRASVPYVFRRHFRQGLRSHIMEILDPSDVSVEQTGKMIGGVRCFPKATPRKMFRIFRARLKTLENALFEIGRVKLVEHYLAPNFMARSTECITDYHGPEGFDLMLCGFQEYVAGEILDPWTILGAADLLPALYETFRCQHGPLTLSKDQWIETVREKGSRFISKIKLMISQAGHIPDLAGAGNLIITAGGGIRLVDINNISAITIDPSIRLDERGYPVCDKSIEALALIEEKILGRPVDTEADIYKGFFDPHRRKALKAKEAFFYRREVGG